MTLLYIYYYIILSNKYIMLQTYFKLLTNCFFFGEPQKFCCPRDDYYRNIWKHDCISGCFFGGEGRQWGQKNHDTVACNKWPVNTGIKVQPLFWCSAYFTCHFKKNTDCYSFLVYSTHYIDNPKANAKNSLDMHNTIEYRYSYY